MSGNHSNLFWTSHLQIPQFLPFAQLEALSGEDLLDQQMPKGGRYEGEEDTGPKVHHNNAEEECTSNPVGDIWIAGFLEDHTEEVLLPPPNKVGGRRYLAAIPGRRNRQRDKRGTH